jgi:hypothetical protein
LTSNIDGAGFSIANVASITATGNVTGGNILSSIFQAVNSAGGALKNSGGTNQIQWGGGGGNNVSVDVAININPANAAVSISPTGSGIVTMSPATTGSINNMVLGNVTPQPANVTTLGTTGNITAAGILTDGYYYANGAPFSGGGGTYGNANVATFLAAFGSNTVSTTGTVTAGNVTGGNILTGGIVTATGNITGGNLITAGIVTATGNITGNYFIGNGSQLTGISGGGSPGGANTQLQFNDAGAFAGNAAMTFDVTSGNINFGNLQIVGTNIITSVNSYTSNTTPNPGRINIGSGKNGDYSANADISTNARGARMWVVDEYVKPDNGIRSRELTATAFANLTAGNIGAANSNSRFGALGGEQYILSGNSTSTVMFVATGVSGSLILGQAANTANAFVAGGGVVTSFLSINTGSRATNLAQFVYTNAVNGNITNWMGYGGGWGSSAANVTGNAVGFYHPGVSTTAFPLSTANAARGATNYHAFRNDDNLAKSRLGSLETFHELNSNVTISGTSITVNKNNGQVQQVYMTGNVDTVTFSNFVTRVQAPNATQVNQADTVTLVIQQGATPYTFTLPTGNAAIRYAGNVSTVSSVANSTVMVSVTGVYNYNTSSDQYLVTVSPEFV